MNIKSAKSHLKKIIQTNNLSVFLHGNPGLGKSEVCKQIANELKWHFVDIRLSMMMPSDLLGLPFASKDRKKAEWLYPSLFPDPDSKDNYLILLDEINLAPMSVQGAAYRLCLDKSLGDHYALPKGARIVAAGNLITDQSGVQKLSKALANRFIHFVIEPDLDAWKEWALKNGINEKIIAFLNFKSNLLSQIPKVEQDAFPSPRTWAFVSQLFNNSIYDEDVIGGTVGRGTASEFFSFIEVYSKLPDINKILKGEKVEIPEEPSVLYAVSSSIALRANPKNIENVFKFCEKLSTEFHILTIRDVAKRDDTILRSYSGFQKWLDKFSTYFDSEEEKKDDIPF